MAIEVITSEYLMAHPSLRTEVFPEDKHFDLTAAPFEDISMSHLRQAAFRHELEAQDPMIQVRYARLPNAERAYIQAARVRQVLSLRETLKRVETPFYSLIGNLASRIPYTRRADLLIAFDELGK